MAAHTHPILYHTRTLLAIGRQVFPLPVEGAETKVLADDQEVMNHMIQLSEALEEVRPGPPPSRLSRALIRRWTSCAQTRDDVFMGWYHSHPFDVGVHSQCFFSSTDVSTQMAWQRSEDPHGNPWVGIVVSASLLVLQGAAMG